MSDVPNLNYIKELSGADTAFEQKFIGIIKKEFPEEMMAYKSFISNKDLIAGAEMVHKLKHKFNILSMGKAYLFAVRYEEELRNKSAEEHPNFILILKQIETYLKTI